MDEIEELLSQSAVTPPRHAAATFERHRLIGQSSPKQSAVEFVSEHWLPIAGVAIVAGCFVAAIPGQMENGKIKDQLAAKLRPASAELQQASAFNSLAAQRNQIAEDRYSNPNLVPVARVVSGEPVYGLDRTLISAGSIVGDLNGRTAVVVAHPTDRFDAATGRRIMRPIADQVYASQGEAYKAFVKQLRSDSK